MTNQQEMCKKCIHGYPLEIDNATLIACDIDNACYVGCSRTGLYCTDVVLKTEVKERAEWIRSWINRLPDDVLLKLNISLKGMLKGGEE